MAISPLEITVRPSTDLDVPAMLAIYLHHITRGLGDLGGYPMEKLEAEDLKRRRKNLRNHRLPHLVAEVAGVVAGYAYVVPFRKRPAYRYTLKHSIYIHHEYLSAGIGRTLLPALVESCAAAGYRQIIGYIDAENTPSLKLHESCGFKQVGLLPSVGFKYGRWNDSVMMQRALGPGDTTPPGEWVAAPASPLPEPIGDDGCDDIA